MRPLPIALVRAANRIDQTDPWLMLIEIDLNTGETLRLVNNNEDVVFQGNTYIAFAFTISPPAESSKGEIPVVELSVANATQTIQNYIEQYSGGVGSQVILYIVNAGNLDEDYAELTTKLTIVGCKASAKWVTFSLSAINPMNKRFPPDQYISQHCRFAFKVDPRCGYIGTASTCNKTLDNCKELDNQRRFGGHPALNPRGLRVV